MSSDALDGDELTSLFVDEDPEFDDDLEQQDSALHFVSAQSLSGDEFADFLRAIEHSPLPYDHQQEDGESEQPRQPALSARQVSSRQLVPLSASGKSLRKKKIQSKLSNKARDGRKEELVYLRKTVLDLETQLHKLRHAGHARSITAEGEGSSTLDISEQQRSSQIVQDTGGLWEEVARHQRGQRETSERENIRLRLVLESQLKVANSLKKFLMAKASASTTDISKCIDPRAGNQLTTQYSGLSGRERDAAIYQDLLAGVEQMLTEVDAVYEENGLAHVETTQISAQTRFDAQQGAMCVELCACKALPFDVHATGAAVWNHYIYTKQRMPSRYYTYHSFKSIDATEDTIIEDFLLELHTKNTRGSFHLRQVSRRMVEEDRVVIVWRTYSDPVEFSEQPLSGLRSLEKGYIVIRKSLAGNSTLLQPCHMLYPCVTLEGDAIVGDTGSDTVVGAITDFMLSVDSEFVLRTNQMVENVLLEQALKKNSSSSSSASLEYVMPS